MDYKKFKLLFSIFSVIYFLSFFKLGIQKIPFLEIEITNEVDKLILLLFLGLFVFTILHLYNERKVISIKFEILYNILIFSIVLITKYNDFVIGHWIEIFSSIFISILIAKLLKIITQDLSYIRDQKEATELNLPRIPYAVFAVVITLSAFCILIVIIWVLLNYYFLDWTFIKNNVIYLIIFPVIVLYFVFIWPELRWFLRMGELENIKRYREERKRIYEYHDRRYQVYGKTSLLTNSASNELYQYIIQNNIQAIDDYFLRGNDPNKIYSGGYTGLIFASAEGNLDAVKQILEHGADPNIKNSIGLTALCFASRYNYIDIAKELLESGADPNECAPPQESPLQIAAINGHEEIVKLLINFDSIDLNRKTLVTKKTALDLAMENRHGNIAKILREKMKSKGVQE